MATTMQWLLFGVLPYVAMTVFLVGLIWRYRFDQYGWTTRSSQLYEKRWLIIGAMMFHYGAFLAIAGHVLGILVPEQWTEALGIPESLYSLVSKVGGTIAVVMVVAGLAVLTVRRWGNDRVRAATTGVDIAVFVMLWLMIILGAMETIGVNDFGAGYNYRPSIGEWFRGLFYLQPDPQLVTGAPLIYQVHITVAWFFFMLFPFSRLVHAFSAPVGYLLRPYVVYRSRKPAKPQKERKWQTIGRSR